MPQEDVEKLNYAYNSATEARLMSTPRLATLLPPGADRNAFQESIMRTFANVRRIVFESSSRAWAFRISDD